ncbi:MAG: hypothetical protein RI907_673, partial [Pseudomonadota bacterium]
MQPTLHAWRRHARMAFALSATWIALSGLPACGGGGGDKPTAASPSTGGGGDTPATVTVSGVLSMVETAAVDSDTNDANQANRRSNSDFDAPQALITPVHVVGSVNEAGQGSDGPNFAQGDESDYFTVELQAGQTVELEFGADS